ncbi:MAG: NUDIX domain-containing protein [Bacteroidaceae bacterium]
MNKLNPSSLHINPNVSVDCVIFGYDGQNLNVLLVRQTSAQGDVAIKLPGSLIFDEEDLDESAQRVLRELTGLNSVQMQQFHAFGSKDRTQNPDDMRWLTRFHQLSGNVKRIVTVAYWALLKIGSRLESLSTRYEASWVPLEQIGKLAFDHNLIVERAIAHLRQYAEQNPILLIELLPRKFTASQLRSFFEVVYNCEYDVRNFHKKLLQMNYVVPLDEYETRVAHRAARYYKFDKVRYNQFSRRMS